VWLLVPIYESSLCLGVDLGSVVLGLVVGNLVVRIVDLG